MVALPSHTLRHPLNRYVTLQIVMSPSKSLCHPSICYFNLSSAPPMLYYSPLCYVTLHNHALLAAVSCQQAELQISPSGGSGSCSHHDFGHVHSRLFCGNLRARSWMAEKELRLFLLLWKRWYASTFFTLHSNIQNKEHSDLKIPSCCFSSGELTIWSSWVWKLDFTKAY